MTRARNAGLHFVGVAFLFSVFVNLLMLTGPLFMLQVYDRVLSSHSRETLTALFLLVGFLYVLMALLDYARGRVVARFGAMFQSRLDERVFRATLKMAVQQNAQPGLALRHLENIQQLFASPAFLALLDLPWSPLFFAAIFILHPMLGWLALAGGAVLIVVAIINQMMTHKRVSRAQSLSQRAHGFADQARLAHEIVQSQGMLGSITSRWSRQREDAQREVLSSSDWTGSFTALTKSLRLFLQSAMLAVGAYLVLGGEVTGGAMIAGSILLGRALAPIEQSLGQWALVQRARLAWTALSKLLEAMPAETARTALPVPEATLSVKNMTVVPPGTRTPTLSGVSFQLSPGKALGVIGRSGSGKSTLARALLGVWPPVSGEIRLGGATLNQYDPDELGRHIGYLPQKITLFDGTIAENIARMSEAADDSAVVTAARRARAHEMIMSLPEGYDTVISGSDCQLSGGQQQRVALARALYGDPVLLILDEPNSALDAEGSDALNDAVRGFKAAGKSVIVMTHRPVAISECDDLIIIDKGQVTARGPRDEVLRTNVRNMAQQPTTPIKRRVAT
ncbi:type I secretion system permease/ATPase [Aliiroseovarius sp. S2029]|uniref:type I secretion system permease/ATPase n=1 Tax=Aliiroseovarius sp. S2029 TaxID=2936988 RepID=UPI0020C03A70|nr:type I secretion system permease/ATPase [Aliiroseovarius sp. S2029]MCK8485484.1 type I secretion system permease/ATPase [Aliiroseovarius sp. S2029]